MMFDRPVVSPVLVGRAEYVDAIARIAEQAHQGWGHVVLVAGEATPSAASSRAYAATRSSSRSTTPHYIMIDLEFASTDEASKVAAALRTLWARVEAEGLIGGQQLRILEVVENKEY
jgi:hypothetical protein